MPIPSANPCECQVCECNEPAEYLEKVYVGKDVAEQMAAMKQQAQDWLKDWADKKQQSTPEQPPAFDDEFPTEPPF